MTKLLTATAALLAATSIISTAATARDQLRIVGSSTVYPFTTAVAEQFGKANGGKTPVVESTGTGGGLKLFCAGVGADHPDVANASRMIKKSEFDDCQKNGVKDIVELKVGIDGLVMANAKAGPALALTQEMIFKALAKEIPDADGKLVANPNKTWKQVDASLPDEKIEVLGPPPTSGTRDSFLELVMEKGAEKFPSLKAMKDDDKKNSTKTFEKVWKAVREDGAWIDAGENDNLIVQKLEANPKAIGVFGYSFLEENTAKVKGATIGGVAPDYDTISTGKYPVARPLFIYVKKQHVGVIPGLKEFVAEYGSAKAIGEDGYLSKKGLVPLPQADRDASAKTAAELNVMAGPSS